MTRFSYYCTLAQAKSALKTPSTQTGDDSKLLTLIAAASQRCDLIMNPSRMRPYFMPMNEQRQQRVERRSVNSVDNTFLLRQPLLAFSAVQVKDTTITSLVERFPMDTPLIKELRYTSDAYTWYDQITDRTPAMCKITGTWGYHGDYSNAWETDTTLAANISSTTATSITVTDGSTFSPGHLIRVNDEYMGVTAVNDETLTVIRAVNGSTATTHTSGDDVDIWQMEFVLWSEIARQVGLMYARRGDFQTEVTLEGSMLSYPADLTSSLRRVLTDYCHV